MQRSQRDADRAAISAVRGPTGEPIEVVVLSVDETLIATLQEAAGSEYSIWHASSADVAVELLVGGHCNILIADLRAIGVGAAALLEKLPMQFPELVLLATGRREEEGAVANLVSKGSVYRFLHKPVSPPRAKLFLAAAARRYHELVSDASPAVTTVRQLADPTNRKIIMGAGLFLLALILGVTWYLIRPGSSPSQTVPLAATTQAEKTVDTDAVLIAAEEAFAAGRLTSPPGENALDFYRTILAADGTQTEAHVGVRKVADALAQQVRQALQARDLPAATRDLTALQSALPDHPDYEALRQQLFTLSRPAHERMERPRNAARPALATPNIDLARARLAAGQFAEPADDSALFYLRQARDRQEADSANKMLATDLGIRLIAYTREAIVATDPDEAQRRLAVAKQIDDEFDLALPDLAAVTLELNRLAGVKRPPSAASAIDSDLARAIRLREDGQLIEPAGENALEILGALAAANPDVAEVRTEEQRLASALRDHARTALAANEFDRADLLASRADELDDGTAPSLRAHIASARSEHAASNNVVEASTLKRTREVPVIYPPEAQLRSIEGWVEVEFTIAQDGKPQNLLVRRAEPRGVFNKAATDALARWRFEPILSNGEPIEQRAMLRMIFRLQ
jgi:TonB family protein